MSTDALDPCGVYVGTATGQIYHSRDRGDIWQLLVDQLPPINSLSVAWWIEQPIAELAEMGERSAGRRDS